MGESRASGPQRWQGSVDVTPHELTSLAAPAHHMARKAFQYSCDGAPPQNMEGEPVVFLKVPQMSLLACVG